LGIAPTDRTNRVNQIPAQFLYVTNKKMQGIRPASNLYPCIIYETLSMKSPTCLRALPVVLRSCFVRLRIVFPLFDPLSIETAVVAASPTQMVVMAAVAFLLITISSIQGCLILFF
jgi:hypothetical protein